MCMCEYRCTFSFSALVVGCLIVSSIPLCCRLRFLCCHSHSTHTLCVRAAVGAFGVYVAPLGLLLLLFNACATGMKVNCAAAAKCKCILVYLGLWHWPNAGHIHTGPMKYVNVRRGFYR